MRNLKKVLSLVLVFALACTLMAGAAFTDQKDIENKDAVNMVAALGIILGYPDGSFNPSKVVTRAEMAKMIYVLKNGGKDDGAAYYKGVTTPLSDVKGHWAEGYINYCYSLGIIAGKGNNLFDPDAGVTGLEAAKMLLIVMGYSAEKAGLLGAQWALKTAALASDAGLFEDFDVLLDAPCPRDFAALLIFNAIEAETVLWNSDYQDYQPVLISSQGGDYQTVGSKYLGLVEEIGILVGSGFAGPGSDGEETLVVGLDVYADEDGEIWFDDGLVTFTKVEEDYSDLIGQEVKVLFKNGDTSKVYGVFATEENTVTTVQLSKITALDPAKGEEDATEIKIGDVKYKLADRADRVEAWTLADAGFELYDDLLEKGGQTFAPSSTVKLISFDGDSKIDLAVVLPVFVNKVTYAGSTTFSANVGNAESKLTNVEYDDDEFVLYEDIEKDDIILVTPADYTFDGKTHVEKVELTSGKVDGVRNTTDLKVGGTWYTRARADFGTTFESADPGDSVTFAAVGGYYYFSEQTEGTTEDLVFIAEVGDKLFGTSNFQAYAAFTDGTIKTIVIDEVDGDDIGTGTGEVDPDGIADAFYTYTEDDGVYSLETADEDNTGFDAMDGGVYDGEDNEIGGNEIDDDAVIVVKYAIDVDEGEGVSYKLKVLKGSAVKKWDEDFGEDGVYFSNKSGGYHYVQVAALLSDETALPGASSDKLFGYLTATPYTVKEDGDTFVVYTVWTGEGDAAVELKEEANSTSLKKGAAIVYEAVSGDEIEDVEPMTLGAIKAHSSSSVTFHGNSTKFEIDGDEDTVFVYVDTVNFKGVKGGSIDVANELEDGTYVYNCYFYVDDDQLLGLVFDVNNEWDGAGVYDPT